MTAPDGYHAVQDPAGFALAVPDGFTRSFEPPRVFYYSPGKEFRIGVLIQDPPRGRSDRLDAQLRRPRPRPLPRLPPGQGRAHRPPRTPRGFLGVRLGRLQRR
ncbi:hypothetical protein GCM10020000_32480 [Streptomyces olivoverticillatus]